MRVLTKSVLIENQEFVLVTNEHEGRTYFATIPYEALDENGCMKREMNGGEMCISFENAGGAINNRKKQVVMTRLLEGFKSEGMEEMDAFKAMIQCEEYKALYV